MRNDGLHQWWTLEICATERDMIKTRFLDSDLPNNSTGFVSFLCEKIFLPPPLCIFSGWSLSCRLIPYTICNGVCISIESAVYSHRAKDAETIYIEKASQRRLLREKCLILPVRGTHFYNWLSQWYVISSSMHWENKRNIILHSYWMALYTQYVGYSIQNWKWPKLSVAFGSAIFIRSFDRSISYFLSLSCFYLNFRNFWKRPTGSNFYDSVCGPCIWAVCYFSGVFLDVAHMFNSFFFFFFFKRPINVFVRANWLKGRGKRQDKPKKQQPHTARQTMFCCCCCFWGLLYRYGQTTHGERAAQVFQSFQNWTKSTNRILLSLWENLIKGC
jgi:hypothetical protein